MVKEKDLEKKKLNLEIEKLKGEINSIKNNKLSKEEEWEKQLEEDLVGVEGKWSWEPLRNAGIIMGLTLLGGGAFDKKKK